MKRFYETKYSLPAVSPEQNFSILILSDIHFSHFIKDSKLNRILKYAKSVKPKYILIPGDLIDSGDEVHRMQAEPVGFEPEQEFLRLKKFLQKLGEIAPVYACIGNHDFYQRRADGVSKSGHRMIDGYKEMREIFRELNEIKNIYILDNQSAELDDLYIAGITLPWLYYTNEAGERLKQPSDEVELEVLRQNTDLTKNLPQDKLKIALIHSPESWGNKKVQQALGEIDYIISGHMHNGVWLPILDDLTKQSDIGLISPAHKPFPKYARNTLRQREDKQIVAEQVTTFGAVSPLFRKLNFLYPTYVTKLQFGGINEVKISRRYLKI